MIPIRSNWTNGYLIRKLIHFLYFHGQKRNEKILVFEGGFFYILFYFFVFILYSFFMGFFAKKEISATFSRKSVIVIEEIAFERLRKLCVSGKH